MGTVDLSMAKLKRRAREGPTAMGAGHVYKGDGQDVVLSEDWSALVLRPSCRSHNEREVIVHFSLAYLLVTPQTTEHTLNRGLTR